MLPITKQNSNSKTNFQFPEPYSDYQNLDQNLEKKPPQKQRKQRRKVQIHQCNVCGQIFSQSFNLKRHIKIHTGEKPYKCEHCEKRFTTSSNLKQHTQTHKTIGNRQQYKCQYCTKQYMFSQSLSKHVKKDHRDNTTSEQQKCSVHQHNDHSQEDVIQEQLDNHTQIQSEQDNQQNQNLKIEDTEQNENYATSKIARVERIENLKVENETMISPQDIIRNLLQIGQISKESLQEIIKSEEEHKQTEYQKINFAQNTGTPLKPSEVEKQPMVQIDVLDDYINFGNNKNSTNNESLSTSIESNNNGGIIQNIEHSYIINKQRSNSESSISVIEQNSNNYKNDEDAQEEPDDFSGYLNNNEQFFNIDDYIISNDNSNEICGCSSSQQYQQHEIFSGANHQDINQVVDRYLDFNNFNQPY